MATGRPYNSMEHWGMRRVFLLLCILLVSRPAFGFGAIACDTDPGNVHCAGAVNYSTMPLAVQAAQTSCANAFQHSCRQTSTRIFGRACVSVAVCPDDRIFYSEGATKAEIIARARATLANQAPGLACRTNLFVCDGAAATQYGLPTWAATVAEPLDASKPPPEPTPADSSPEASDYGKTIAAIISNAIAEINREIWYGVIAFDVILFLILLIPLRKSDARIGILGSLAYGCVILSIGLSYISPSLFPSSNGDLFYYPIVVLQRAATIGISAAGFPFLALLTWNYFFDVTLPKTLPRSSKHIEVLIARSQRRTWFRRVVFMLDTRIGVNAEQFDLMRKYRLGRVIVYDSLRRQRQNELARTHLEMARDRKSKTICLWREEVRGFFRRIYYLVRSLISFLIGFLFIRITIGKLLRGAHIESKSLDRILEAKNAIETGASDLHAYLIAAETFDGREDIFEPA